MISNAVGNNVMNTIGLNKLIKRGGAPPFLSNKYKVAIVTKAIEANIPISHFVVD